LTTAAAITMYLLYLPTAEAKRPRQEE
ncbi:MAG: hypothetical protein H6Q56_1225, partial [Deltaproteobacteria bacterium]|nr:hypothetical protein [Deltaproteobacteria bacterium]